MSSLALTKSGDLTPSVFDDFFRPWDEWFNEKFPVRKGTTVPAVNIKETKNEFVLSLAIPGLKKTDFKVDIDGDMLTIRSEKEESKEEKDGRYTRKEYNYSAFCRSFSLPDEVNQEKIEAKYEDGELKLHLPKKENGKNEVISKHISIK
jgi:HSP20 family protein